MDFQDVVFLPSGASYLHNISYKLWSSLRPLDCCVIMTVSWC